MTALFLTLFVLAAFVLGAAVGFIVGVHVGTEAERDRITRTRQMIEDSRRNHPTGL
jgi:hypothetical protein